MTTKFILTDCVVTVNGVDFTNHCSSVEVAFKRDSVDTTNFSAGGGTEAQAGLIKDTFTMELQQDYSTSEVDQTLSPLYASGAEFPVTVQPQVGSRSATNPTYSATCILLDYTALSGKPGQLASVKLTFPTQRTGISRLTS